MESGSPLAHDFGRVIDLCEQREGFILPAPLRQRIARCVAAAIEKALVVGWYKEELGDGSASNSSIIRAAERVATATL